MVAGDEIASLAAPNLGTVVIGKSNAANAVLGQCLPPPFCTPRLDILIQGRLTSTLVADSFSSCTHPFAFAASLSELRTFLLLRHKHFSNKRISLANYNLLIELHKTQVLLGFAEAFNARAACSRSD